MKLLGAVALAALALAAAVPTAQAQSPTGVTVDCADLAAPVPYSGSGSLACTVSVGCVEFLSAMDPSASVTLAFQAPPPWLQAQPVAQGLDPSSCLTGAGSASGSVALPFSVAPEAPGVVEHALAVVATVGGTSSEPDAAKMSVAYHWNYTVVPDVAFPLTMTTPKVSFNLTVTQASNARSMVMMEEVSTSAGVVTGLTSTVYENEAGKPATKVFPITYTAPTGEWTTATVSFMAYGHYLLLDSSAGDYDEGKKVTFEFANGGIAPHEDHEEGGDDQLLPAPAGVLLALGLVALAALARRRA